MFVFRKIVGLFSLSLIAILLFSGCAGNQLAQVNAEKQNLAAKVQALQQDLSACQENTESARGEVRKLSAQLQEKEKESSELAEKASRFETELDAAQLALSASMDSKTKELANRLQQNLETEQNLKSRIEKLEISLSEQGVKLLNEEETRREKEEGLARVRQQLTDTEAMVKDSEALLGVLREELAKSTGETEALRTEQKTLKEQLESTSGQIKDLMSDLRLAKDQAQQKATEQEKLEQEVAELKKSLEEAEAAAKTKKGPAMASPEKVQAAAKVAKAKLSLAITGNTASVETGDGTVRVILYSDELFRAGTTRISDGGLQWLASIEEFLNEIDYTQLLVEGHTDNVPVRNMPYPDNWELAAARAAEAVRWLAARPNIDTKKIIAQSHSYYAPIASNETAEGRRKNRRVEIVVRVAE